jgi:type IV pilus assembly protein PilM
MFIAIFDDTYSLYIFDQEIPVFSLVQNVNVAQLEGEKYMNKLEQEIAKISNYYRFNVHDGNRRVQKVVLFNMANKFDNDEMQAYFNEGFEDEDENIVVFQMKNVSKIVDTLIDRECYIPLAASLMDPKGIW